MPEYLVKKLQMQIAYLQQKYMEWLASQPNEEDLDDEDLISTTWA